MENNKEMIRSPLEVSIQMTHEQSWNIDEYTQLVPTEYFKKRTGNTCSLNELLIIQVLEDKFKLSHEVINVLLDYVLKINNMKVTKGFIEKVAVQWTNKNVVNVTSAIRFAKKEYADFCMWQKRKNLGGKRELTVNEREVYNRLLYKTNLNENIINVVIDYSIRINDGHVISWFTNRVAEYLEMNHVNEEEQAKQQIEKFHEMYVKNFGQEHAKNLTS